MREASALDLLDPGPIVPHPARDVLAELQLGLPDPEALRALGEQLGLVFGAMRAAFAELGEALARDVYPALQEVDAARRRQGRRRRGRPSDFPTPRR